MLMDGKKDVLSNNTVVVWGAGYFGKKGLEASTELGFTVDSFCDNNQELWGTFFEGVNVISPTDLEKQTTEQKGTILVIIALLPSHGRYEELSQIISNQVKGLGVENIITSAYFLETYLSPLVFEKLSLPPTEIERFLTEHCGKSQEQKVFFLLERYQKLIPQKPMNSFILNIIDHCNLNCQRCDHYSPLAKPYFVSLECVTQDMKQMSHLLGGTLEELKVEGGEALLHPELLEILSCCRNYFPKTKILLMTNGTLLLKQSEEFWTCCRENQIVMSVTKYPVSFDYDKAEEVSKEKGVDYWYFGGNEVVKTSYKLTLNPEKTENPKHSFTGCHRANHCLYLMEGKFYPCPTIANVHYLNQEFNQNFQVLEDDFREIHQVENIEELTEFVARPTPFCAYCVSPEVMDEIPWAVTKKDWSEWLPLT